MFHSCHTEKDPLPSGLDMIFALKWMFHIHSQASQSFFFFFFLKHTALKFGEGNGTPLQYSCLENPMGGGAW